MPYFSSTNFFPFLLISFFYIISTKLIPPEYNNGIHQDPNLDKSYLDKTGQKSGKKCSEKGHFTK